MNSNNKTYLTPSVDHMHVAAMHCLCDSSTPSTPGPDISFGGGAKEKGQTTTF